jgi:hypothetical protein
MNEPTDGELIELVEHPSPIPLPVEKEPGPEPKPEENPVREHPNLGPLRHGFRK